MVISDEYRRVQIETHKTNPKWGTSNNQTVPVILDFIKIHQIKDVLDYGCGKGMLREYINRQFPDVNVRQYDPCMSGWDELPEPGDYTICMDVLEHIELECLQDVLGDLRRVTDKLGLLSITTVPARTLLTDGSNPHKIMEPLGWWKEKLKSVFSSVSQIGQSDDGKSKGIFWVAA